MNLHSILQRRSHVEEFLRKHEIGLLTVLFTDIAGSTRLKQEFGDSEAVAMIQRHHAAVREDLGNFKEGEEICSAGDPVFMLFAQPSAAVKVALPNQAP